MSEMGIYAIVGIIALGFFWRWIDRVDKKIDNILDYFKGMASKTELLKLEADMKMETNEIFKRLHELEQKYSSCINCKSK